MHRRFLKSLATVMGAAALIVAPMAASAQAAVIDPDETMDPSRRESEQP